MKRVLSLLSIYILEEGKIEGRIQEGIDTNKISISLVGKALQNILKIEYFFFSKSLIDQINISISIESL